MEMFRKCNHCHVDVSSDLANCPLCGKYLLKNNEIDIMRSAALILNDLKNGRIGKITIEKWEDK